MLRGGIRDDLQHVQADQAVGGRAHLLVGVRRIAPLGNNLPPLWCVSYFKLPNLVPLGVVTGNLHRRGLQRIVEVLEERTIHFLCRGLRHLCGTRQVGAYANHRGDGHEDQGF